MRIVAPTMTPAESFRLRPVTARDVPDVVALVTEVLAEFGLAFGKGSETDDAVHSLPQSYEAVGGAFWVAEREGHLLGTCGIGPIAPGESTFELRKMYLRPAARGAGVGRRLLEAAIAFAREHGAKRVVLDTTHEMTDAIRFYERAGFVRDDTWIRGSRCSRGYVLAL
jgi:putative acetyltransferase